MDFGSGIAKHSPAALALVIAQRVDIEADDLLAHVKYEPNYTNGNGS